MTTQEMAIKPTLKVTLRSDSQMVDEIVVVAYGSARKSTLTGSVDIVRSDQLTKVPVTSFDQALQGKSAGVQVTASTGRPGAGANIKIRGTSSISAGSSPLYVIDGVPLSSTDFASINANDIEYMSILKDASATAIYGSRGSNGVILVTTKKGKSGKTAFNIRAQYGISTKTTDQFEMMNAQEKLTYERQLGSGYGATGGADGGAMTDAEIAGHQNTNWSNEIFRTGVTQLYELNMSGGSEKTKFYISGQYYNQEAIIPGSYLTRGTARVNVEHTVSDRLKVGVSTSAGVTKEGLLRNDRNALNPFNYVYSANPYDAPYNRDGSYNTDIIVGGVPLNLFENINNNVAYINRFKIVGAFNLEWKIWDEIKYVTVAGIDFNQSIQYQFNKPESQLSNILSPKGPKGYRNDNFSQRSTWLWTNMLAYEKTFNSVHTVKAIVGMEAQSSEYRNINAMVEGFPTGKLDAISIGSTNKDVAGGTTEWKMLSYLGSAGYTYDDKYLMDVAVRRDGSSRFGTNSQYGTFWATGLGWNMERETFLEDVEWLSRLKIRGSIGTSGNNNIGDYAAQGVYGYGTYNGQSTAYPGRLPNPDLSWEKSMQASVGLDASFFDSRLNVTFDVYKRKTTDLLLATQLSRTSGFSSRIDNIGELENKGYELAINGDIIRTNDWTLTLSAMVAQNKNKIIKLYEGNEIKNGWNNLIKEDYPINVYKMVRWAGVNPANGDALYYTKNDELTNVYNSDDAVILDNKTPDPKFFGSFGAKLTYKGFEFSSDFYFSGGNYIYNHISFFTQSDGSMMNRNLDKRLLHNQWTKPGDITNVPQQRLSNGNFQSTRYLEDASYLRLRNATLAYTLPKRWLKPLHMETVRVYAQGLNLFTVTNFSGLDPEVGDSPSSAGPTSGLLDFSFPAARSIMFGIEVGF